MPAAIAGVIFKIVVAEIERDRSLKIFKLSAESIESDQFQIKTLPSEPLKMGTVRLASSQTE